MWHVAGLELRKDFAQHTGEEFLETVFPNATKVLNFVQNFTFFDKQWIMNSGQFSNIYRYG